jgi:hypothetical protein
VEVEENEQLLFYAGAAMRTKGLEWVFDGAASIELVIVQPPSVKRWKTTAKRIREFEKTLKKAIDLSETPDAPLVSGKHCKWCAAKPTCPLMTGEVDRALKATLDNIDAESIANYLQQAEKKLKALKLPMPDDVVAVVSSGSTMAHESDPRPTVLLIGQQLTNALNKL